MIQYNLIIIGTGNISKGLIYELLNSSLYNNSVFINVYLYSQSEERLLGYLYDLQDTLLMKEKIFNQKINIKFSDINSIDDAVLVDCIICCTGVTLFNHKSIDRDSLYPMHCELINKMKFLTTINLQSNCKLINITNPVDEINRHLSSVTKIPNKNIYGIGLSHDIARIIVETGMMGIEAEGKHGKNLNVYLNQKRIDVHDSAKERGLNILALKGGRESPIFAPVASLSFLLFALIFNTEIITYVSVWDEASCDFLGKKICLKNREHTAL
ncbi:lactate/malate family dehydrogenase [Legionella anisa]|uniref:lactate/malate family dehydrogenase n=1 Tax=Legionella anisa TaxID=28082 RepID=UPI0010418308|nr:hypothetical protein [Legionella anisa]